MKLNEKEIYKISVEFMMLFFALAKKNTSFLNVLLGFTYAAKTIPKAMERLGILSGVELNKIDEEITKAADASFEDNLKLIKVLKQGEKSE